MITIAHMTTLEDAYRGMDLLRQHAIPPALSQEGDYLAIRVDEDFATHAQQIFTRNEIAIAGQIAAGPSTQERNTLTEDDNN